jgi:hypothetical protein
MQMNGNSIWVVVKIIETCIFLGAKIISSFHSPRLMKPHLLPHSIAESI